MALTDLETRALLGIIDSDYRDGDHPVDAQVWTWSANPFPSPRTFSGVVASLTKKGFVISTDEGNDSIIYLTQAGFDALRTEALPELIKRDRHKDWGL